MTAVLPIKAADTVEKLIKKYHSFAKMLHKTTLVLFDEFKDLKELKKRERIKRKRCNVR